MMGYDDLERGLEPAVRSARSSPRPEEPRRRAAISAQPRAAEVPAEHQVAWAMCVARVEAQGFSVQAPGPSWFRNTEGSSP